MLGTKGHLAIFVAGELFPELSDFQGTVFVSSSAPVAALTLRQNASPLSFTTLPVISRAATRLNFNLPHVANGEFSGRSIRTSFIVFNISSATASINLSLSRDDGAPFSVTIPGMGTDSSFNLDLNPGAAAFFGTDGAGEVAAGAAVLDSDQPLGVAAIFTIVGEQGQFLTEAGVGDSVPLQEFVIPVDSTGQFDTGIALFNGRTVPVAVTFRLLNSNGNEDNSASLSLGENSHMAQFVSGLFPTASDFRGSLSVSASNPLAALTLRQNAQPLSFTTLPVAEGVGSPAVTGTWKGTYSLTVDLKSTCSNLNAVTHSGELTLTISQAGDGLTGTAELTGVKEIVESASSNCTVGDPVTVSGNFTGTLSGRSISGEISFGDAPAGQLTLGATAAAAGVEKIVLMGSLSNSNRSLIGELENERLDPEKRSGSGAFFLEKLQESLCDTSAECDGILKQILNICGGYKERVIEFAGEANGYSFRSFLCTDDRANDDCDGILRPIAVPCPDPAFQDCTTPCGGGPVLSSSFALDHQCNQSTSEEVEEDQKLCNVICTACIPVKLTVKKIGSGSGMVTLNPAGESCGEDCTQYDGGKEVTLEAKPDDDSIFKDLGGDCEGTAPCNLKMTTNKEVTATFDKKDQTPPPSFTLTVSTTGTGEGRVTSQPTGIDCPGDCDQRYIIDEEVTLTAEPTDDSTFEGWSGDCSGFGTDPSCKITMDKDKTATATFEPKMEESPLVGTWEGPYTLTHDMPNCAQPTVTHSGTLTVVFSESGGNVTGDFTATGIKNVNFAACTATGSQTLKGTNVPVKVNGNRVTSDPIEEILGLVFDGTIEGTTLEGTLKEPEPVVLNSDGTFELIKKL